MLTAKLPDTNVQAVPDSVYNARDKQPLRLCGRGVGVSPDYKIIVLVDARFHQAPHGKRTTCMLLVSNGHKNLHSGAVVQGNDSAAVEAALLQAVTTAGITLTRQEQEAPTDVYDVIMAIARAAAASRAGIVPDSVQFIEVAE